MLLRAFRRHRYPAPVQIDLFTLSWLDKAARIATGTVGIVYGRDRFSDPGPRVETYQWIASPTSALIIGAPTTSGRLLDDERWLLMDRLTKGHGFGLLTVTASSDDPSAP